jgi:cell division protein FtsB
MIYLKKIAMRIFLVLEMFAFGYVYICGKNGLQSLRKYKNVVIDLKKNITQLDQEVAFLEKEIHVWQSDDFYKEKIAREQLQMARKGDELFYIGA